MKTSSLRNGTSSYIKNQLQSDRFQRMCQGFLMNETVQLDELRASCSRSSKASRGSENWRMQM